MRKLFLLLALGAVCSTVNAQENSSVMFSHAPVGGRVQGTRTATKSTNHAAANHSALKTTNHLVSYADWFDYWDENATSSATQYYFNVYPDSNLVDGANNVYCQGLGMSFDPTDNYYYDFAAVTNGISDPQITATTAANIGYSIDSFFVAGKYIRNNPTSTVVDSLIIDLIATSVGSDSGTYKLQFGADAAFAGIATDSTPRFASALYTAHDFVATPQPLINECWDSIKVLQKQRYAFPLTAAFQADSSTTTGDNDIQFNLTTPLVVNPGQKVVSFVAFKSGVDYPLGTSIDVANYYHLYAGDPAGSSVFPQQNAGNAATGYAGSYQDGLIAQSQIGYDSHGANSFTYMGHPMLIPACAFVSSTQPNPTGFEVPLQAFHVTYSMMSTGVATTTNKVSNVTAFPNPANNQLNISYTLTQSVDATVSLINVVGQTVATQNVKNALSGKVTFNTSDLSAGVYIYSINANGVRTTGRVVIAH